MSRVLSSAQTTQATKWSYSQVAAQLGGAVAAVIFIAGTVLNIFEDLVFRPKGWGDELRINEARVRQDMELREKEDADEARMLALVVEQQRCRRLGLPIPSLKKVDEEHVVKRKQRVVKTAVPTLRPEEIASTSGADPILLTREANSHYLQNLVKKAQTQVNTDDTKKHTLTIDEVSSFSHSILSVVFVSKQTGFFFFFRSLIFATCGMPSIAIRAAQSHWTSSVISSRSFLARKTLIRRACSV
jgi:hypothetical protein